MSDNYLRICPVDPTIIPSEAAAHAAVEILGPALPDADKVLAESFGFPTFIDQGANLVRIICPQCAARLSLDDESVSEWWYSLTDPLQGLSVNGVKTTMPCCAASVEFSALTFDWPAAIASFEISVLNPGIAEFLPANLLSDLELALGCKLQQIWAHY